MTVMMLFHCEIAQTPQLLKTSTNKSLPEHEQKLLRLGNMCEVNHPIHMALFDAKLKQAV